MSLLLVSGLSGYAITFSRGAYSAPAIFCVALAVVALGSFFGYAVARPQEMRTESARPLLLLLWAALVGLVGKTLSDGALLIYAEGPPTLGHAAQLTSLLLLATYLPSLVAGYAETSSLGVARFGAFLALTAVSGLEAIHCSPRPLIDVWGVQMDGAAALLHGHNPYTTVAVHDTGPGTLGDAVPYVYPPTQLYLTLVSRALGDVRITMLVGVLIAAVAMRLVTTRSARPMLPAFAKDAPALFLLLTPKLLFVIEQSWVDPVQVMLVSAGLASVVYARRKTAAVLLGLAASSKQTMFWIAPLAGFCLGFGRREWLWMLVAAIVPVIPFAIWNFPALAHANFEVLNDLPRRRLDALTINNWVLRTFDLQIPGATGFILAGLVVVLGCWRLRQLRHFALTVATTYILFFAFNRWAFANYYFLVAAFAGLAAAGELAGTQPAAELRMGLV
jgi:hypothetical protein